MAALTTLTVRAITPDEHLAFVTERAGATSVSFLQCPSWAAVKSEWGSQSLGWYDADGTLVGAGLVLLRQVPKVKRFLTYLPEGPVIDWAAEDLDAWLDPMVAHLRSCGRVRRQDGSARRTAALVGRHRQGSGRGGLRAAACRRTP